MDVQGYVDVSFSLCAAFNRSRCRQGNGWAQPVGDGPRGMASGHGVRFSSL